MKITVINATEKRGVTYRLKEMFLAEFKNKANITEYYLPKDCPNFCVGCTNCILKGEKAIPLVDYVEVVSALCENVKQLQELLIMLYLSGKPRIRNDVLYFLPKR